MAESQTSEIWRVQSLDVLFLRGAEVRGRPGKTSGGARPSIARVSGGRRQIY